MSYQISDTGHSSSAAAAPILDDPQYYAVLEAVATRFQRLSDESRIFATDVNDSMIWNAYLSGFTNLGERQHYNCNTCRHFLQRYGSLVVIHPNGDFESALWPAADIVTGSLSRSLRNIHQLFRDAKITGVFTASERVLGSPVTGPWRHFAITQHDKNVHRSRLLTAFQVSAAKKQNFLDVQRALAEYKIEDLSKAVTILEADMLYQGDKVLGGMRWLRDLSNAWRAAYGSNSKQNIIWRAVADAPEGFCHPRSSMAGTLLDDLATGYSFDDAAARFKAKMHPIRYQRPQAAPSAGTIRQAEETFAKLGAESALRRRYLQPHEIVEAVWRPKPASPAAQSSGGIFSHIKPKGPVEPTPLALPTTNITWRKFAETVLPNATSMKIMVSASREPFFVLTTAVDPSSYPILQWDNEQQRNPVAWYTWVNGSYAREFGLASNRYLPVYCVTKMPHMWYGNDGKYPNHTQGVLLCIEGGKETKNLNAAIFPSTLKNELHGVRSVIEAHSKSSKLEGFDYPAHVVGFQLADKGKVDPVTVKVVVNSQEFSYRIDRWD